MTPAIFAATAQWNERTPVRWGRLVPVRVDRAPLFRVSEEAGWITGIVLDVAGGAVTV